MTAKASYRDLLKDREPVPPLGDASPYDVGNLMGIMRSAQQGAARTDRSIPQAEDELIASLWKLANRRPHQVNSEVEPDSPEDKDINNVALFAEAVAYDAAALRALLDAAHPELSIVVDQAHTNLLTGLLAGHRELDGGELLSINSTYTAARVRGTRGSLKR